jgi:tetratricopeptide (TPR) repeat protein
MSWWHRLTGGPSGREGSSRAPNYLAEALELETRGDYANALTSYRLALRERPDDPKVLQNIAIAFSKTGQPEEAIRHYRRALEVEPSLAGAHYGLAFLLLKRHDTAGCAAHLEAFLRTTRRDGDSAAFVAHAERTLAALTGEAPGPDDVAQAGAGAWPEPGTTDDAAAWSPDHDAGPAEPGSGR